MGDFLLLGLIGKHSAYDGVVSKGEVEMASAATSTAPPVGKSSAPKRNNAARIFGYDVFISFALGPPPRGTHSYASDLARRLRERDFTVFFSEDEAPPGEQLDSTLLKALLRSHTLVVIANRGTLQEPRWVRQEVEQFTSRHADRPIIPISIGGALQDATLAEQARQWLKFDDKIWLDDSEDAVAQGIVSDELVKRLALAPAGRSSNVKWRRVIRAIVAVLAVLTVAAIGFGIDARRQSREAKRQQGIAVANAADAKHQQGVAEGNAAEAKRQQAIAETNETKAKAQERIAKEETAISKQKTKEAQAALARFLVNNAEEAMNVRSRPDWALAYAAHAVQIDPESVVARNWVSDLLLRVNWWLPRVQFRDDLFYFSSDGRRILTVSPYATRQSRSKTAQVWDVASGKAVGAPMQVDGDFPLAVFSPDGGRVLTWWGSLQMWNAETGAPIGDPLRDVDFAVFSGDGQRIMTSYTTRTATAETRLQIWEVGSGERKPVSIPLRLNSWVRSAVFTADGQRIVAALQNSVQMFQVDTGKPVGVPVRNVRYATFSGDGRRIVTVPISTERVILGVYSTTRESTSAQIWEADSGKPVGEVLKHKSAVSSAVFSRDGRRVATTSQDTAQVWDTDSGNPVGVPLQHEGIVTSAAFSPDGRQLVTASQDNTARVWEVETGKPVGAPMPHESGVGSAVFSGDGRRATTTSGKTARVWELGSSNPNGVSLQHEKVTFTAFSGTVGRLVTASDSTMQVWDLDSGKPAGPRLQSAAKGEFKAFSADGRLVLTESEDYTGQVLDVATGKPIGAPLVHEYPFFGSFSDDGRRLVTASEGTVQVWEAETGKAVGRPLEHKQIVWSAVLSADGHRVLIESPRGTLQIRNVETGKPVGSPLTGSSLWLSPDGRRVLAVPPGRGTAQVLDADTSKPLGLPLQQSDFTGKVTFSPDGRRVVTTSRDTAQVWEVDSGKPVGAQLRHNSYVSSAVFSPDGQRVVTTAADQAQVWEVDSGKPVGTPLRHIKNVGSAAFSRDGRWLATRTADTVHVWEVVLGSGSSQDTALLVELAELASGYRVNEFAALSVLGFDERIDLIKRLRAKYNVPVEEDVIGWLLPRLAPSNASGKSTASIQARMRNASRSNGSATAAVAERRYPR
jgi:WD40 repeat protein